MEPQELAQTYDTVVHNYAQKEYKNPAMEKHYSEFMDQLKKGSKILVVGCGPGHVVKKFVDNGHFVTGIDVSPKMIDYAKTKVDEAEFYVMDVGKVSFNIRFDAIWAGFALIHVKKEKYREILNNFLKILQPTGFLFLGMLEGEGEKVIEDEHNKDVKNYLVFMTRDEMEDLFQTTGFELMDYKTDMMKKYGQDVTLSFNYATRV